MLANLIWTGIGLLIIFIACVLTFTERIPADRSEDWAWVDTLHAMNVAHFGAWVENATAREVDAWLKRGKLAIPEWVL